MIKVIVIRWRDQGAAWFSQRAPREQGLIGVLAILVLATAAIGGVWRPLLAARAEARADIRASEALMAQLRVAGAPQATDAVGPAPTRIANSAGLAGLTIRRLEPEGALTRVVVEEVEFGKALQWLQALERDAGLGIAEVKLERRPAPGIVNLQLTARND